jgi:uncharacterized protein (DUF697 family)
MIDYFFYKIREAMNDKKDKAEKVIKNSVIWSMGAGLIPIPLADMMAVTAIQIDMIKQLADLYGIDFSESRLKPWLTALSGSVLSRLGANAVKFIPGIGSVLGGISMAALSGASTYAAGQVFITHFEAGGTLNDFDADKFKDFYTKQFEKGKAFVEDLQKEQKEKEEAERAKTKEKEQSESNSTGKAEGKTNGDETIKRLKELSDMLSKGIITQDEFRLLKERLINSL